MYIPIVLLNNEKMDDVLGNRKYVIYTKKGAFAQQKHPKVVFITKLQYILKHSR